MMNCRPALGAYAALFRQYDFVFARDAYNALQLAIVTEQRTQCDSLIIRCGKSGVPEDMLRNNALVRAAYADSKQRFIRCDKRSPGVAINMKLTGTF